MSGTLGLVLLSVLLNRIPAGQKFKMLRGGKEAYQERLPICLYFVPRRWFLIAIIREAEVLEQLSGLKRSLERIAHEIDLFSVDYGELLPRLPSLFRSENDINSLVLAARLVKLREEIDALNAAFISSRKEVLRLSTNAARR